MAFPPTYTEMDGADRGSYMKTIHTSVSTESTVKWFQRHSADRSGPDKLEQVGIYCCVVWRGGGISIDLSENNRGSRGMPQLKWSRSWTWRRSLDFSPPDSLFVADCREGVSFSPAVDQAVKLLWERRCSGGPVISPLTEAEEEEDGEEESLGSDVKKSRCVPDYVFPLPFFFSSCNSQFHLGPSWPPAQLKAHLEQKL